MILYISLFIPLFLLYILIKTRYGGSFRTIILKLLSSCQNYPSLVLKSNPKLCKLILESSDSKGKGIEFHLSLPGFLPIYNSESVDGEKWKKLLSIFRKIVPCTDYNERLPKLIKKHIYKISEEFDEIDSLVIQILTIRILFELVFKKELINKEDEKLFLSTTNDLKKHVAQKGYSNIELKEKTVNKIIEYLKESEYDIDKIKEEYNADKYEMVSMFLQPFIISPAINFGDLFAEIFILINQNPIYKSKILNLLSKKEENQTENSEIDLFLAIIYETLRLKHPFPIIERDLLRDVSYNNQTVKKGTHVYIELDNFEQNQTFCPENWLSIDYYKENQWILFAAGPRMCAGKQIAQKMFEHMLRELIMSKNGDFDKFKTWKNHTISGRRNDNTFTFEEVRFQVFTFGGIFIKLFYKRILGRK